MELGVKKIYMEVTLRKKTERGKQHQARKLSDHNVNLAKVSANLTERPGTKMDPFGRAVLGRKG